MDTQNNTKNHSLLKTQLSHIPLCPKCRWELAWADDTFPHKKVECVNSYCELFGKVFVMFNYPEIILWETEE